MFLGVFTLICENTVLAQSDRVLQGFVYSESDHNPIVFASISVKNSSIATTTDALGRFEINIASEKQTIIVISHTN